MGIVTYAQNFEDVLLWRALEDVQAGFYIDVGAWDPDLHSVTRAFSERGWHGINVEPVPHYLNRLIARRPRDINLGVALGAAPAVLTFHEVAGSGLSTLVPAHASGPIPRSFGVTEYAVTVATLAAVCEAHAPDVVHFLKIDCEGSERAVLEGADFTRFRPWIVVIEATAPLTDQPSHEEWEALLTDASYRFAWFDGLNRFYVAAEHHDRLAPRLALPPNVFDDFQYPLTSLAPPAAVAADPLAAATPVTLDIEGRIDLAASCRDCDDMAKVADAGRVMTYADGSRVQIMHNGLKVVADGYCGEWMTRLIARCRGHHEPQEERVFHALAQALGRDATMIELGSNWGYYSCWFLLGEPARRAVLLEPDPQNRMVGERNLALNGLRAPVIAGFAGAESGQPRDFVTENGGIQSLSRYSVARLMDEQAIEVLDLLHCDTQGAELDVLSGCLPLFRAERIRWLLVSTHVHQISHDCLTHQRCLALLRDAGAVIQLEHTPYESFSGDGLIVASFGDPPSGWQVPSISRARTGQGLFRDPVFDLAEASPLAGQLSEHVSRAVQGAYQAILLRDPDQAGIDIFGKQLLATGDMRDLLASLLHSPEFAAKLEMFVAAHVPGLAPSLEDR